MVLCGIADRKTDSIGNVLFAGNRLGDDGQIRKIDLLGQESTLGGIGVSIDVLNAEFKRDVDVIGKVRITLLSRFGILVDRILGENAGELTKRKRTRGDGG